MKVSKRIGVLAWLVASTTTAVSQAQTLARATIGLDALEFDSKPTSKTHPSVTISMHGFDAVTPHYNARVVFANTGFSQQVLGGHAFMLMAMSATNDRTDELRDCPAKYLRSKTNTKFWIPGVVVLGLSIVGNAILTLPGVYESVPKGAVQLMPIPLVGPWVALADTKGWMTAYAVGSGTLQLAATAALLYGVTDKTVSCRLPR